MKIYNIPKLKNFRKTLRKNMTPQEIMLWSKIKNSQLDFKFRRQHSVGSYILDFYCPTKKLAIEIDGSQHFELDAEKYDEKRSRFLNNLGIKVTRFDNGEINTNMKGVLEKIYSELHTTPSYRAPLLVKDGKNSK